MEIARHPRFTTIRTESLQLLPRRELTLEVAGTRLGLAFDPAWGRDMTSVCRKYWSRFLADSSAAVDCEIFISPVPQDFRDQCHAMWFHENVFIEAHDSPQGRWIFHRDFSCLVKDRFVHAWLPDFDEVRADPVDNLLGIALRPFTERQDCFMFHSTIVEHHGEGVVFFGPSGIGKSTAAGLCFDLGMNVMSSDQAYLRIEGGELIASASPSLNPEIPRDSHRWRTEPLKVKALVPLRRRGSFEVARVERVELARAFFAEIFRDESDPAYAAPLRFTTAVLALEGVRHFSLSYPKGENFWPTLEAQGRL